jgi:hypothetical protein
MFAVDGYPNQKSQLAEARWATPNYFSAMGIPLIAGRLFTADEKPESHTIIINQSFARKYLRGATLSVATSADRMTPLDGAPLSVS